MKDNEQIVFYNPCMTLNDNRKGSQISDSIHYYKEYHRRTQNFMITSCLTYTFFLLLFFIWTLFNLWERWNQIIEPVSSNGFDIKNFQQLIYPAITVCNLVPNVKLIHKKCYSYENDISCEYEEHVKNQKKTLLNRHIHNQEYCLSYNNNIENAFVATNLGVQDMFIISLSLNIKEYPISSLFSGVSILLHSQDKQPAMDGGLLASPGDIFLVRLKKNINEYLNSTTPIDSYDAKISTIGDQNFEKKWGPKNDTIVLAFTYQDLNVMIIRELPPYTIFTFLSETGGVLGLLLGTSLVNLIVLLFQWSWGLRLNEFNWASVQNKQELITKKSILKDNIYNLIKYNPENNNPDNFSLV